MCRAKPLSSIPTIIGPPPRKMTRTNLELLGDLRGALACHQPPYRRELHLPVENPPFSCGHPAFLGTVFLVFVSHFWGALHTDLQTCASTGLPGICPLCISGTMSAARTISSSCWKLIFVNLPRSSSIQPFSQ